MEKLNLSIVTPLGKIFDNEVLSVNLPGLEGEFGVLPRHIGILTTLVPGVIEFELEKGVTQSVAIQWGTVKVGENSVDVLVDQAVAIKGDTDSEISKAIDDAKTLLREVQDSDAILASVEAKIESASK